MKTIGFIGLGAMGLPMALNLCRAGFPLLINSSNPQSAAAVEAEGAKSVASFKEMAEKADVIITILPTDKEVIEIYTSEGGLVDSMQSGAVCIDMTSASGTTKQAIAEYAEKKGKPIGVIDAPVSGGAPGAKAGTLTIMVGCDEELYNDNLAIFEAMGQKIVHTGDLGSASNIKTLNQMLNAGNSAVACEVLSVAKKMGVDLNKLYDIVNDSSGGSFVFKNNTPRYVFDQGHEPGFRLDLMKKDVGLFLESSRQTHSFTPIAEFVHQVYKATSNQGHGDKNTTYIFKWYEDNQ